MVFDEGGWSARVPLYCAYVVLIYMIQSQSLQSAVPSGWWMLIVSKCKYGLEMDQGAYIECNFDTVCTKTLSATLMLSVVRYRDDMMVLSQEHTCTCVHIQTDLRETFSVLLVITDRSFES